MGALLFWTLLWSIIISLPITTLAGLALAIHRVLARTNGSKHPGPELESKPRFFRASSLVFRFAGCVAAASIGGFVLLVVLAALRIVKVEAF